MEEKKWIEIQDVARFEVRVGDINYGGHMGNDKALLVFHDARIRFFEILGFSEKNIGGPGIIMRDAHVHFKREVFLHDLLSVDVGIEEVTMTSFTIHYTARRIYDKELVFKGTTGLVAFDYEHRKVVKLPVQFIEKISSD